MFKIEVTHATWCDDCGADDHGVKIEISQYNKTENDRNTIIVHVACLLKRIGVALLR